MIGAMKIQFFAGTMTALMFTAMVSPALASGTPHGTTTALQEAAVPVPANPVWVTGLLLMIVWVVVAAVLLGPLIVHFRLLPKGEQVFADDLGGGHSHSAAATTSH